MGDRSRLERISVSVSTRGLGTLTPTWSVEREEAGEMNRSSIMKEFELHPKSNEDLERF